ncbi:ABC transporter permease (plasmid) [Rhizobium leguminosarum]|uniref:ABC transporter permease n=1 Tax=Rhizobium leguminosarum TaxID=384 RepID=A0A1L3ZKY8_RHILE|nr:MULTISPECIES: sugar ABC transporter permease [Rhizobium]API56296.1 ABC transporter permease [Rhizobium leguminosarum]MBY3120449.1 sugar ABC transporter permease [Rhizobium laguerreae]MBY3195805.1 sugar ABC transporter permease [Rhizobium laguerreae]MBY3558515.1 sugar ABC transporter permease [Rhizobium laguerreae]MBY5813221.1 sugar ABC transporter permease [Rhizobium leguminosarum]
MSVTQVKRIAISDSPWPWLLPLVSLLVVFTIYPLIYNVWLSFHEFMPRKRALVFVGFANWVQLWHDTRFWGALGVTFVYFTIALVCEIVLGMAVALLLDAELPGFGALRAVLSMTLVIPPAIAGMMFLLMEDPQFGVLTYFLNMLGLLDKATPILATSSLALAGVLVAEIWQWTPFMVLIFMAGLRSLPPEPYEAAMIDGASSLQMFRRLTLPMMSRVIAVAVLLRGIDLFRVFDYVFVMTSGGPGTSTYSLSLYAWQQTFSFLKWGYGATLSLVSLAIVMILANLFIRAFKVRW